MRSLTKQGIQEIIRLNEWTARSHSAGRWKVTGPNGTFTLHEMGSMRWRFVFGTPRKNNQRRQTLDAAGIQEAISKATETLFGKVDRLTVEKPVFTIEQVFKACLDSSGGEPYHRATLKKHSVYFCNWCRRHRLKCWHEILPQHLRDYADFQFKRGCHRKTVQHYFEPVRLASAWAANNHPESYRHITEGFRLPSKAGNVLRYRDQNRRSYLPIGSLLEFIEWLPGHTHAASVLPGVALQGLCGLQLLEALRLTWDRVDLMAGTITIEEDRRHDPNTAGVKNRHRVRKLPLPKLVHQILVKTQQSRQREYGANLIIQTPSWKAYCHRVKRSLTQWRPSCQIPPKDLRNTLPTEAERSKWMSVWARRYFGHAPATTIEAAYLAEKAADEGVTEGTDAFVEKLHREVVRHIDAEIQKCKKLHLGVSMKDISIDVSIG